MPLPDRRLPKAAINGKGRLPKTATTAVGPNFELQVPHGTAAMPGQPDRLSPARRDCHAERVRLHPIKGSRWRARHLGSITTANVLSSGAAPRQKSQFSAGSWDSSPRHTRAAPQIIVVGLAETLPNGMLRDRARPQRKAQAHAFALGVTGPRAGA